MEKFSEILSAYPSFSLAGMKSYAQKAIPAFVSASIKIRLNQEMGFYGKLKD